MDTRQRLLRLNPCLAHAEIDRWIPAGREYAARFPLLSADVAESVGFLFCCYGLAREPSDRARIRAGIDALMRPFYPGVDRHAAAH